MAGPTIYPELNEVLAELVTGAQEILGESFYGAYLQGSFAVGDADEHSDVDFLVVIEDEVSDEQAAALQAMHQRIYTRETPWAQHLEGSYITRERLRRVDPSHAPLLYLDNGATELTRDSHCNIAVVRWSLRVHGVVLSGPQPKTLVDPVAPDQLRAEVLAAIPGWVEYAHVNTKAGGMSRWLQPLVVLSFCRMLQTLSEGRVTSKRAAGEWALGALDPEWADLIRRALGDRPDPWARVYEKADPHAIDRTFAFVDYALGEVADRFWRRSPSNALS